MENKSKLQLRLKRQQQNNNKERHKQERAKERTSKMQISFRPFEKRTVSNKSASLNFKTSQLNTLALKSSTVPAILLINFGVNIDSSLQ